MAPAGFLDDLLASTRRRVDALLREAGAWTAAAEHAPPPRGFADALRRRQPALIAEIKRATPSRGDLAAIPDPAGLASAYARGGAAAVSVLVEPRRFKGGPDDVRAVARTGLPVLFKDFVIDEVQVAQARALAADAVLVIARIAPGELLGRLLRAASAWGMDALVEVHDEDELRRAADAGARLIGINHRDLDTFEVDASLTRRLAPLAPADAFVVALSGVADAAGFRAMVDAGAGAVLVGEALVRAGDPESAVRAMLGGVAVGR